MSAPGTGPSVVAVGGGHGLAASLRAARTYAGSITAVVSVADDGGSSGRLRAERPELPAPGDVRRCLTALAAPDSALGRSLEHRFPNGPGPLAGHALGNLLLVALTDELGSFGAAVDEVAWLVGAVGRVLPATVGPVSLEAVADGQTVGGQVAVQNTSGIRHLRLVPPDPESPPEVAEAIEAADQVILGPGSLFTSVLAAATTPAVLDALLRTSAQRVLVSNLRPQVPETEGFELEDYLLVLADHGVPVDAVVCDAGQCPDRLGVVPEPLVVERRVAYELQPVHDAERLGAALAEALGSSGFSGVR